MERPAKQTPKQSPSTPSETESPRDGVRAEIARQIGPLLPKQGRDTIVERISSIVIQESFSGPIAHPRHLREYEEILPGSAERIIRMAEERNHHHMSMDREALAAEVADRKLGMWLGAGLFFALIAVGGLLGYITANPYLAGIFVSAAVLSSGIGLFIRGRNNS